VCVVILKCVIQFKKFLPVKMSRVRSFSIVTLRAGRRRFDSHLGQGCFFATTFSSALGSTQPPYGGYRGLFLPGTRA
jgi:hypothetical protein